MKDNVVLRLVIVESPAKCKKIEGFLGPGYKCMASYGHITTLESLKDVEIDNHFQNILQALTKLCSDI